MLICKDRIILMRFLIAFIIVSIASGIAYLVRKRRVGKMNAEKKCLSCGAEDLQMSGDFLVCMKCGYENSKGLGGRLSVSDLDFLKPEKDRLE